MEDKLKDFRGPMVTSIGIILGFVLGFTGKWALESDDAWSLGDTFVGIGLLLSTVFLITALFRILKMDYPRDKAETYYKSTLQRFVAGLVFAFLGITLAILQSI